MLNIKLISGIIIVVLIIASIGFYLMTQNDETIAQLTAMEALEYAQDVATQWNSSAKLVMVFQRSSDNLFNGLNDLWIFSYATPSFENGSYWYCEIIVSMDGNVTQYSGVTNGSFSDLDNRAIINWIIDSDEAIVIANNSLPSPITVDYYPPLVSLSCNISNNDNATWYVYWYRKSGPLIATIVQLDAATGEIIHIQLDDKFKSPATP